MTPIIVSVIPSVEVDPDPLSVHFKNCSSARFNYFYEEHPIRIFSTKLIRDIADLQLLLSYRERKDFREKDQISKKNIRIRAFEEANEGTLTTSSLIGGKTLSSRASHFVQ